MIHDEEEGIFHDDAGPTLRRRLPGADGEVKYDRGVFWFSDRAQGGKRGGMWPWVKCGDRTQRVLRGIVTQAGVGALVNLKCRRGTEGELQKLGESYRRYGAPEVGGQERLPGF